MGHGDTGINSFSTSTRLFHTEIQAPLHLRMSEMEEEREVVRGFEEEKLPRKKYRITVEPLGYLFVTAFFIQIIVNQNLFLDKVCRVNFNLSASVCDVKQQNQSNHSRNDQILMDKVQSYVSVLNIYASLINNVLPIFVVLFLGPWSDKNGRKPLMKLPIVGVILSSLIYILNYFSDSWPAEYLLLANIPVGLFGGVHTLVLAINSYLVDITTEENRTLRLALMAGVITLSIPVSNILASIIFKSGGYIAIYCTALAVSILAFYYVCIFITDSRGPNQEKTIGTLIKRILFVKKEKEDLDQNVPVVEQPNNISILSELRNLWKCFSITFRPRLGNQRACISLLLVCICLTLFSNGGHGISYLYTRKKFSWDVADFSLYLVGDTTVAVLGTFLILPLMTNYFKIHDIFIGIVSLIGQIASNLTVAFAVSGLMMRLSSLGLFLAPGLQVVIRSLLSKIAGKEDMIYVYSVVACLEAIIPLFASPTFNLIYILNLNSFIGASFLFEVAVQILQGFLFFVILYLQRKDQQLSVVRPFRRQSTIKTIAFD